MEILWEDAHGLAVVKPSGLLTQRGSDPAELTLERLVRSYLRPGDPDSVYLGTVHRLDRPVSGVILWAKTPKAARRWADQFRMRTVRKEYAAIVAGTVGPPGLGGVWDDGIGPPDAIGRAPVALDAPDHPGFAPARTGFEVVAEPGLGSGWTWLTLRPETGRTHQLRAQSAARGWPIAGDQTYGSVAEFPRGIALHARSLTVRHPVRHEELTWVDPVPPAWTEFLRRCRSRRP